MNKVSVIIPNYNHARYLKKRIDSVLTQTYTDFEVIILDDCSTDSSREIIRQYEGHPKVSQVLFNETNSGNTFFQWKKGMEIATGTYIWIAESDDFAEKNFLETLVSGIETFGDISIAFCQSFLVNQYDKITFYPPVSSIKDSHYMLHDGESFIQNRLSSSNDICNASMAIFRKDSFFRINDDAYLNLKFCGDWYFWVLLSEQGRVFETFSALNYYRRHEHSVSHKATQKGLFFIEGLIILKKIRNKLSQKDFLIIIKTWSDRLIYSNLNIGIYIRIFVKFSVFSISFLLSHCLSLLKNKLKILMGRGR